ncbi:helix-turn-helix domain-containing protein [Buttiauxella gaviniae]|uniref:helix-turn-helix domain-containing protein n=1 Tax=Buttiauxella gaviniae TaxID=82990 RepID=UPI003BB5689B
MEIKQPQDFFLSEAHAFCLFMLDNQEMADAHGHDFDELVIVRSGSGFHIINDQVELVYTGDFFFVSANDTHYYESTNNLSLINLLFHKDRHFGFIHNIDALLDVVRETTQPSVRELLTLNESELQKIVGLTEEVTARRDDHFDAVYFSATEAAILEIVSLLCRCIARRGERNRHSESSGQKILNYVRQNYCRHINWDALCEECGMAKRTMFRFFKEMTGTTPEKFQQICCLLKAQELLRTTDRPIKDVALFCGFINASRLTDVYKKRFSRTPSQERHLSYSITEL